MRALREIQVIVAPGVHLVLTEWPEGQLSAGLACPAIGLGCGLVTVEADASEAFTDSAQDEPGGGYWLEVGGASFAISVADFDRVTTFLHNLQRGLQ